MSITNRKTTAGASLETIAPGEDTVQHILDTPTPGKNLYRFTLNHPKNYLGVPLAIAASDPAEFLIPEYLVSMVKETTNGAEDLGLITRDKRLTKRGLWFVSEVETDFESSELALQSFSENTHTRFCETYPSLTPTCQAIFATLPDIQTIIAALDTSDQFTLPELTYHLSQTAPKTAKTVFLVDESPLNSPNSTLSDDQLTIDSFEQAPYRATSIYQLKSLLYHLGILTTSGTDTTNHTPTEDIWALSPHLSETVKTEALDSVEGVI